LKIAFIVGSAIPQVQTISSLVAAICIMQFTYSFPPLMLFGYYMQIDALALTPQSSAEKQDPTQVTSTPTPTVSLRTGGSRLWFRAFFYGRWPWYFKLFNLVLFLGSLAMACLGMYGAGKSIQQTFAMAQAATSFGCTSPV
jgi:hypothetical protein